MLRQPQARHAIDFHGDLLGIELGFEFDQEFVHYMADGVWRECAELDNGVESIAEFRTEHALDFAHRVGAVILAGEADRGAAHALGTGVGGHDDNDVAEIRLAAIGVSQGAVVHDL